MRRLNRYISRTVFYATLIVLFVLSGIHLLSVVVSEARSVGGDYTFGRVMEFVGWSMPAIFVEHITNACFLGSVIGLGIHAGANELVVIRAAGVGMLRLMWAVLRPVLVLALIGLAMSEYIIPLTLQQAKAVKELASKDAGVLQQDQGSWLLEGNTFIHFRGLNRNLFDIVRYELDDERKQLLMSSYAEQAIYSNQRWEFDRVFSSYLPTFPKEGLAVDQQGLLNTTVLASQRVSFGEYFEEDWQFDKTPVNLNDYVLEKEEQPLTTLYRNAIDQGEEGIVRYDYWLAFWTKLLQPVLAVALTLVGISFVFGSMREVTVGQRLTIAVLLAVIFKIMQEFLGTSSLVYQFNPLIAMIVPILLCFMIGITLLQRR